MVTAKQIQHVDEVLDEDENSLLYLKKRGPEYEEDEEATESDDGYNAIEGIGWFNRQKGEVVRVQLYYDCHLLLFCDALTVLGKALTHMNSKCLILNDLSLKVSRVTPKKNSKWRALRMELKGIGLVTIRTLLRSYFDESGVNEKVIRTVQPDRVRLYSENSSDFVGAGTVQQFKEAVPVLFKRLKKNNF